MEEKLQRLEKQELRESGSGRAQGDARDRKEQLGRSPSTMTMSPGQRRGAEGAAQATERKCQGLRREMIHRQRLAEVKSKSQPSPGGPAAPAAPPAAHRGPAAPGPPLGHGSPRKEEGPAGRAQESGVTCRCDSASPAAGS